MKIIVVRHGESTLNSKNLICGVTNARLSSVGYKQAIQLKQELKKYVIDYIYCSPLIRAKQTTNIISEGMNIPYIIDERIMERNYGDFEGKDCNNPKYIALKWELGYKMPGKEGESIFHMIQRVYNFLDEIVCKHQKKTVLVVCHCGVCRIISSYFTNMLINEFKEYYINNCEYQIFEV